MARPTAVLAVTSRQAPWCRGFSCSFEGCGPADVARAQLATVTGGKAARLHSRSVRHRPRTRPVLVRSVWRADVELRPWEARFEIADRRVVAPISVEDTLSLGSHPFAAIIRRELAEAALTTQAPQWANVQQAGEASSPGRVTHSGPSLVRDEPSVRPHADDGDVRSGLGGDPTPGCR
jgi:hypothetical protein